MVMAVVPLSVSSIPGFWCICRSHVCVGGGIYDKRACTSYTHALNDSSKQQLPAHHVVELEEAVRDPLPDVALRLLAPQVRPQLLHQLCWSTVVGRSFGEVS